MQYPRNTKQGECSFICVEYAREWLKYDDNILECAALLKVGLDRGDEPIEIIRRCVGNVIYELMPSDLRHQKGNKDETQNT